MDNKWKIVCVNVIAGQQFMVLENVINFGALLLFIVVTRSRAIDKPIVLIKYSYPDSYRKQLLLTQLCFLFRATEQQSSPPQHPKSKAAQLPFCINDSLALAHKHYNQKKIKQLRFLFKHRENCLLKKTNLLKRFQSQPNIYRNWNCEECGL